MDFKSTDILEQPVTYGTFWQRFAAMFIDGLIIWIPMAIIGYFIFPQDYVFRSGYQYDYSDFYARYSLFKGSNLLNILAGWLYYALQESSGNQATVGKKAMGLIVTDLDGHRISFGRATGRFFGKYLSGAILFIGYLMMLWTDKRQTLHDKLAETLVVRSDR